MERAHAGNPDLPDLTIMQSTVDGQDRADAPDAEASWRQGVRIVAFLLMLAGSVPFVLARDETLEHADGGKLVGRLLGVLLIMAIIGSVRWGLRRLRKRPRAWWRVTFTAPVMLATFVMAAISAVGLRQQERAQATSQAASVVGSTIPQVQARQDAFVRWLEASVGALRSRARLVASEKRVAAIENAARPDAALLQRELDLGYLQALDYRRSYERLPSDDPKLLGAKQNLVKAASYEVGAWRDYADGFRARDFKRMERGDVVKKEVLRYLQTAVTEGNAVYRELGGAQAFSTRPDFERVGELVEALRSKTH